jgi:glycosyltransferase involved in cell wall biosynthesis
MKIALVSDWFVPRIGGLEHQMRDLARELAARGHDVEIITATPGAPVVEGVSVHRLDIGPVLSRIFANGQPSPRSQPLEIWSLVKHWRASWDRWLVGPLERLIGDGRFDVVHGHSAFSPLALAACWSARRAHVPSVLTEHSVLSGFGHVLLEAAERVWGWSAWPDVISAVSTYLAGEMRVRTKRDVEILPNGITPEQWTQTQDANPPRVVSVMRLTPRKRGIELVRSIPRVIAKLPSGSMPRFTLVGGGPEQSRIEQEAVRLGVRQHLELTGWLDRSEVRQVLSRSTIFVLPTIKEARSIATLEALSAGLPVVAMSHGGVGDIVRHGREGFLADTDDEFCNYIVRLLVDEPLRRRMADVTKQAAARFRWDGVIERHLEIYDLARARRHGELLAAAE